MFCFIIEKSVSVLCSFIKKLFKITKQYMDRKQTVCLFDLLLLFDVSEICKTWIFEICIIFRLDWFSVFFCFSFELLFKPFHYLN